MRLKLKIALKKKTIPPLLHLVAKFQEFDPYYHRLKELLVSSDSVALVRVIW